jgi:hypothetical protein
VLGSKLVLITKTFKTKQKSKLLLPNKQNQAMQFYTKPHKMTQNKHENAPIKDHLRGI